MRAQPTPWLPAAGLDRLLMREANISDLLLYLTERDPSPWADVLGFVPNAVMREARSENQADLFLETGSHAAVVEVKLGHSMSTDQQERYEALASKPDLYLAALGADEDRVSVSPDRWKFLSLADLIGRWEHVDDILARTLAGELSRVIRTWDIAISSVFNRGPGDTRLPLASLRQKFLARVVTRRIALDLRERGVSASASVTSGGGLALVQGWVPVRNADYNRTFTAEVRWQSTGVGGELRFGIDFEPLPGHDEDMQLRKSAFELACDMDSSIDVTGFVDHVTEVQPGLSPLLFLNGPGRPDPRGDWQRVIEHGFSGAPLPGGKRNTRRTTTPGFFGDGALRFQAKLGIDFERASAQDVTDVIVCALDYLSDHQP